MKCHFFTFIESNSLCKTEIDENHRVVICAKHDAFVLPQGDQMITHEKLQYWNISNFCQSVTQIIVPTDNRY